MSTFRKLLQKKIIKKKIEAARKGFFCIEAIRDSTISLQTYGGSSPVLYYGRDNDEVDNYKIWERNPENEDYYETIELKKGKKLFLYGDNKFFSGNGTTGANTTGSSIRSTFIINGATNLSGKLASLLSKDLNRKVAGNYCFNQLFYNCKSILDCSRLVLVPTSGSAIRFAYSYCFSESSITKAPFITTSSSLSVQVFSYCFYNCKNLVNGLNINIYSGCSSNTFRAMYRGCTSLKEHCDINIRSDAGNSAAFGEMFYGCTKLNSIINLKFDYYTWQTTFQYAFYNCTSLERVTGFVRVQKTSRTDQNGYFTQMFQGCTSLIEVPIIIYENYDDNPERLHKNVFHRTFYGCSSLKEIKVYAPYIPNADSTTYMANWLYGVPEGGTIWLHKSMIEAYEAGLIPTGASGIPASWTVKELTPDMLPVKVDF